MPKPLHLAALSSETTKNHLGQIQKKAGHTHLLLP
jgi:DNA-binding CsgD family transcriptional regulator